MPVVPEFLERDYMQLNEVTLLLKYIHQFKFLIDIYIYISLHWLLDKRSIIYYIISFINKVDNVKYIVFQPYLLQQHPI